MDKFAKSDKFIEKWIWKNKPIIATNCTGYSSKLRYGPKLALLKDKYKIKGGLLRSVAEEAAG